ncbi:hypothetical protein C8F04DRAFT_1188792 [Mycena alexandri]|uniref:Uncharacterized protein n=1 Tax=Mycena alexandri TaxID=1745969 RepID=A0AAD6WYN1_9AGAR|nr:hypothetical protein C8F04DRAFT_1188792 [Mycena alexandri]
MFERKSSHSSQLAFCRPLKALVRSIGSYVDLVCQRLLGEFFRQGMVKNICDGVAARSGMLSSCLSLAEYYSACVQVVEMDLKVFQWKSGWIFVIPVLRGPHLYRCFQQSLLLARLSALHDFNIVRGSKPAHIRHSPYVLTWVSNDNRGVSLRLQSVAFAWVDKGDFTHLRILVLRDLSAFRGRVAFGTGAAEFQPYAIHCPVLKELEDFNLCFGTDTSFEHAIRYMRVPSLRAVKFTAFTAEEFDALGRCSPTFCRITTFILDGIFDEQYRLMRIFLNMPSLIFLELLSIEYAATEALLAADRWLSTTFRAQCLGCPNLSVVAVAGSSWDLIASFIKRRYSKGGRLSQVMFGDTIAFWCIYDGDTISMRPAINDESGRFSYAFSSNWVYFEAFREVPFDVWSAIFECVLQGIDPTLQVSTYSAQRKALRDVCVTWRFVARGSATFWTAIYVHAGTCMSELWECIRFSKVLQLRVVLHLHADAVVPADRLIGMVAPILHRCQVLWIHVTDCYSWDVLRGPLQSVVYTGLQDFTLSVGGNARSEILKSGTFHLGALQFDHPNKVLSKLRLHSFSYDWRTRPSFWSLNALTIVDPATCLSWLDFRYIATVLATLQRLCLRNVCCTGMPADPGEIIIFPSIVELDLYFGSAAPSVSLLIRRCTMPNLESLRFHADDFGHIMTMVFCETTLSTVRRLVISSTCGESFYWLLFTHLPLLRRLDILSHDRAILRGLMEADMRLYLQLPSQGPACPMLEEISTRGATAYDVREFFMRRAALGTKLAKVVFTGGFIQRMMSEADLPLLKSCVLVEKGEPFCDPTWSFLSGI